MTSIASSPVAHNYVCSKDIELSGDRTSHIPSISATEGKLFKEFLHLHLKARSFAAI